MPFVGREHELQSLTTIATSLFSSHSLETMWIEGEAGIGKTRLLQAFTEECNRQQILVCHVCLYPDTSFSLLASIATLLVVNPNLRRLLLKQVEPSLPSVMDALRRLSRLRPLVLILEDVHLLESNSVHDIAQLGKGLSNESLVMLFAARPDNELVRNTIRPDISNHLVLGPLDSEDVRELTSKIVQKRIDDEILSTVMASTKGFPLLIRSLIPDIVEACSSNGNGNRIRRNALSNNLSFIEMWTAKLDPHDLSCLKRFAHLGEFFSLTATTVLEPGADHVVQRLHDQGLIVVPDRTSQPQVLSGTADDNPIFRFTHTLVHEALAHETTLSEDDLCLLFENDVPLYSSSPFQQLQNTTSNPLPGERVERVLQYIHQAIGRLVMLPQHQALLITFNCAEAFFGRHSESLEQSSQALHQASLIVDQLNTLKIASTSPEFLEVLDTLLRLTKEPISVEVAELRLKGLHYELGSMRWPSLDLNSTLDEIIALGKKFPELLANRAYVEPLGNVGMTAAGQTQSNGANAKSALFEKLYQELTRLLESEDRAVRHNAGMYAIPWFIMFVLNQEDIRHRYGLLEYARKEFYGIPRTLEFIRARLRMVSSYGNVSQYAELVPHIPRPLSTEYLPIQIEARMYVLGAIASFGAEIDELEEEIRTLIDELTGLGFVESLHAGYTDMSVAFGHITRRIGYTINATSSTESLITELGMMTPPDDFGDIVMLGDSQLIAASFDSEPSRIPEKWQPFRELFNPNEPTGELLQYASKLLQEEIVDSSDLFQKHVTIKLTRLVADRIGSNSADNLRKDQQQAIIAVLEWCAERNKVGWMKGLLDTVADLLPERTVAKWRIRYEELLEQNRSLLNWQNPGLLNDTETKVSISIIGDITITRQSGTTERISGSRMRSLIGLLASNSILKHPLSTEEFRIVATGRSSIKYADTETGTLYKSINRLRKLLGSSKAIVFQRNTSPRFNPNLIRIDIVDVLDLLEECKEAAIQLRPRQAYTAAMSLFERLGNQTAWPGLFDDFFDRMRTDLEFQLRDIALSIAHLLRSNNDDEHTEKFLTAVLNTMYDEEIYELLKDVLEKLGRNVDLIRLKWKQNVDTNTG